MGITLSLSALMACLPKQKFVKKRLLSSLYFQAVLNLCYLTLLFCYFMLFILNNILNDIRLTLPEN
jgi:hypothetical protein